MKMKKLTLMMALLCLCQYTASAQEDEFDMSSFETAGDAKSYCNNKVVGISPSKLLSISYDWVGSNTWEASRFNAPGLGEYVIQDAKFNSNSGLRLETNYPIISTNSLIVNAYLNYWESHYNFDKPESGMPLLLDNSPLRSTVLGAIIFKPLDEKRFIIIQADASLNGNYNFGDISPEFGKAKFSGALLYGWKRNDNTNVAVGVTRTYRGGSLLHIPVLLWNKTFNSKWGVEMLLPARAAVRRNFSSKSLMTFGYELEGQSYHLQGENDQNISPVFRNNNLSNNDWEFRKSEIRARLSWDKSITDFIWFNAQVGAVVNYRVDIAQAAGDTDPWITNDLGVPFYFRFGIQLVSP